MLAAREKVTLFGRFLQVPRDALARLLAEAGAATVKDLTRQTTLLAVGGGAVNLIPGERLGRRLAEARHRGLPVLGEGRLLERLSQQAPTQGTLAPDRVAAVPLELLDLLNAFDLVRLDAGKVPFADAETLRTAAGLADQGLAPLAIVDALRRRQEAPKGRHRLDVDVEGRPVLVWDDGVTTLTGQGLLNLDEGASLDAVFEAALEAEHEGDLLRAARLYETCQRADKRDPIAPFNLGNVHHALGDSAAARLAYQIAVTRDPRFAEAHFNLAGLFEAQGDIPGAARHLRRAMDADPDYGDPHFNLGQIELGQRHWDAAGRLFRRYLDLDPSPSLADKARTALRIVALQSQADPPSAS